MGNIKPITLYCHVTAKDSPRAEQRLIKNDTKVIGYIMSEYDTKLKFQMDFRVPEILGAYSSMGVTVGIEVPADTTGLTSEKKLAAVLDPYKDTVVKYLMTNVNEASVAVGKPAPFPS